MPISLLVVLVILGMILATAIRVLNEYERGVRFTLGRFSGTMNPGLRIVLPILQSWRRIDIRTKTIDVPDSYSWHSYKHSLD